MAGISKIILEKIFRSIRKRGYRNATGETPPLLSHLEYKGQRTAEQVEALLIKFVDQFIPSKTEKDILLMAFRLLKGYEDDSMIRLFSRRSRYVLDSHSLKPEDRAAYKKSEDDKSRKAILDRACNTLSKTEDRLITKLTRTVITIQDISTYIEDVDEYLDPETYRAILPQPSYLEDSQADKNADHHSGDNEPLLYNGLDNDLESQLDHVSFNSIKSNPKYGDERNFAHIKESDASDSTYTNRITLKAGQEYTVFVYNHNNTSAKYNKKEQDHKGIALGYLLAKIPSTIRRGANGVGSISIGALDDIQDAVFDNIYFANNTDGDISLRYVHGSAVFTNFRRDDRRNPRTFNLPDFIISAGTGIGFDSMSWCLPDCNRYSGYVTFNLKAVQPNFSMKTTVRKGGTTSGGWSNSIDADHGDEIEYLITYKNTGSVTIENVIVTDTLPKGIAYVPGSTKLSNGNGAHQVMPDGVTTVGLNIGNYAPDAVAYVWFKAKVNAIINTCRIDTSNGAQTDAATVFQTQ